MGSFSTLAIDHVPLNHQTFVEISGNSLVGQDGVVFQRSALSYALPGGFEMRPG